jgi:hypothetical protein
MNIIEPTEQEWQRMMLQEVFTEKSTKTQTLGQKLSWIALGICASLLLLDLVGHAL